MGNTFNKALKESINHGRYFPNTAKWALIEDVLVETIHSVLTSIIPGAYTEDLLTGKINAAADKARVLIKN